MGPSAAGADSFPLNFQAEAWSSTANTVVVPLFQLQAEATGNNTPSPSATLNLLSSNGTRAPAETGFSFNNNGTIHFAPGQTFPGGTGTGTITGVTAGTALTGGGTTGNVTLNLEPPKSRCWGRPTPLSVTSLLPGASPPTTAAPRTALPAWSAMRPRRQERSPA